MEKMQVPGISALDTESDIKRWNSLAMGAYNTVHRLFESKLGLYASKEQREELGYRGAEQNSNIRLKMIYCWLTSEMFQL